MKEYFAIFRLAYVSSREARSTKWVALLAIVTGALLGVALLVKGKVLGALLCLLGGFLAVAAMFAIYLLWIVQRLAAKPELVWLVPGQRQRLLKTYFLTWLCAVLSVGGAFALSSPEPALAMVGTGVFIGTMMCMFSNSYMQGTMLFGLLVLQVAVRKGYMLWLENILLTPEGAALGLTAMFAYGWWVANYAVPAGGDRHYALGNRVERMRKQWEGGGVGTAGYMTGAGQHIYARALARLRFQSKPASDALALGLGRELHWSADIGTFLLVVGLQCAFYFLSLTKPNSTEFLRGFAIGLFPVWIIMMSNMFAYRIASALVKSRTEQAVMRLTPGVAQGRVLNEQFAGLMLRRFVQSWLLLIVSTVGMAWLFDHANPDLPMIFGIGCLPLLAVGTVLRDFGELSEKTSIHLVWRPLVVQSIAGLAMVAGRFLVPPMPWWILGGACVLASIMVALAKRKTVAALPVQIPVGRYA